MKWVVAPLLAGLLLTGSGFLNALERTTLASVDLAEASKAAPKDTEAAADELADLPAIARLTGRQAEAFKSLADALQISGERVVALNEALSQQGDGIKELAGRIGAVRPFVACVERRLRALLAPTADIPPTLASITSTIERVDGSQEKALRHLRSINRKLTALGVVASASGVQPPPPPGDAPPPEPGPAPEPLDC